MYNHLHRICTCLFLSYDYFRLQHKTPWRSRNYFENAVCIGNRMHKSAIWEKIARQQKNCTATEKLHEAKPSAI